MKGVRKVALQNVKDPEKWLQVKDDELSGNVSEKNGFCIIVKVTNI